ncbi:hypothetical protein C9374_006310 [Naegleria lovaniensis]|uniref:Uncharacterized protein n=1 Tax=Naegleria lovaniensis TaxID=51637 RepID=A0AA88KMC5_NAELO|nr:uncharacterized protein C9374_006310 [Naegleria lovaniensis]KAG2381321.1 hypothetical protein C9374_006310 [Naegleria lovaniensis]
MMTVPTFSNPDLTSQPSQTVVTSPSSFSSDFKFSSTHSNTGQTLSNSQLTTHSQEYSFISSSSSTTCSSDVLLSKISTAEHYDSFLEIVKEGRMRRVGPFKGLRSNVKHACQSKPCGREWSPSPIQIISNNDYYCPSCVLHHRNNVERFKESELEWTSHVPNTFYVFQIQDPNSGMTLVKFGRTQHEDALKRYSTKELTEFNMKLLLALRGRLETMTNIENWWKEQAEAMDLFSRFSIESFHGLTECVELEDEMLEDFLAYSKVVSEKEEEPFKKWLLDYEERIERFKQSVVNK